MAVKNHSVKKPGKATKVVPPHTQRGLPSAYPLSFPLGSGFADDTSPFAILLGPGTEAVHN